MTAPFTPPPVAAESTAVARPRPQAPAPTAPPPQAPRPRVVSPERYEQLKTEIERIQLAGQQRGLDDTLIAQSVKQMLDMEFGVRPLPEVPDAIPDDAYPGFLRGLSMAVIQGTTFGFGDEALGYLGGLIGGVDAREGIDKYRREYDAWRAKHGKTAFVAELAGGLPWAFVPGAAPLTFGRMAAVAAGTAAISGAGNAEGGLSQRAIGALTGAVVGGATLGAVKGAATVVGAVAKPIARSLTKGSPKLQDALPGVRSPEWRARRELMETILADGLTPAQLAARAAALAAHGVPVTTLDVVGDATLKLVGEAASVRSPLKTAAVEDLLARQGRQPERIANAFATLVGANKFGLANAYELEDAVRKSALDLAKPWYEKAYQESVKLTPRLKELIQHPRFREAYDLGRRLADDESLAGIGHGLDIPDLPPPGFAASLIAKGVPAAKARALADQAFPPELPIRALDYMKRGVDILIDKGLRADKTLDNRAAQSLASMRGEIVKAMRDQSDAYLNATGLYAGEQEFADALVEGQAFLKLQPGKIAQIIEKLNPSERDAYRIGATQSLYEYLLGAPDAARKAGGHLFGARTPNAERIRALFPDAPDTAEHFIQLVNGEARLSLTTQRVTSRGPSGASPQALEQELEGNIPLARGNFALTLLSAGRQALVRQRSRLNSEVGDELLSLGLKGLGGGPQELHAFLSGLEATARSLRKQAVRQRATAIATGTVAGKFAGGQAR